MLKLQLLGRLAKSVPGAPALASQAISSRSLRHLPLEPEYLDSKEVQIPNYGPLNVQMKAHDFTILETFSGYVHKTAENLGLEVADCWAVPGKKLNVTTYKPLSNLVEHQYTLNVYERNVQVTDLPSTKAPIFLSIIQAALPVGVKLTIKPHEAADEEVRYVPDQELKQLKSELENVGASVINKNTGWKKNK